MSAPNILIIDDEPESVEIVRTTLVTKQYKVSCAYSADEGFASGKRQDLISLVNAYTRSSCPLTNT